MGTWVKFCGCESWDDVERAVACGANAVGFIFAPSPRRITPHAFAAIAARFPETIEPVGVFVDPSAAEVAAVLAMLGRTRVQLSGSEPPEFAARFGPGTLKVLHVTSGDTGDDLESLAARYPGTVAHFDTKHPTLAGGSGTAFVWERIEPIARHRAVVVAGGLDPKNVGACVRGVRPFGVDVRGGIETDGRKDERKMRAFVAAVRAADAA